MARTASLTDALLLLLLQAILATLGSCPVSSQENEVKDAFSCGWLCFFKLQKHIQLFNFVFPFQGFVFL